MEIGIFHYSMPPVIGGVERVIAAQARLFRKHGFGVRLYHDGRQTLTAEEFPVVAVPGCGQEKPEPIRRFLRAQPIDLWIVHNLFTMPFCLAATAALWELAKAGVPMISWVHDLAAINPHYQVPNEGLAALLRQHPPGVRVVTVSSQRQQEYAALTGHAEAVVIPNGVDFPTALGLPPSLAARLPDAFPILLHPTRLLRRKNIQLGLEVTAELGRAGKNPLYIISGAPEHFSGDQQNYRRELEEIIAKHQIADQVLFLGDDEPLDDAALCALYRLADAVFFPSEQEGFGLPVLEAALQRTPVFCSENLPLSSFGQTFSLEIDPSTLARRIESYLTADPACQMRRVIRQEYDWDAIFCRHIAPLLKNCAPPSSISP